MKPTRKYYALYKYLQETTIDEPFTMTFSEIEKLIGNKLPRSARSTRAWWANTPTTQSESWLSVDWLVDYVNFVTEEVTFRPKRITYRVTPIRRRPSWSPDRIKELRDHAGWTQQELADHMGVRQQTISEWETGLHVPRYSTSKHLNLIAKEVQFAYQVEDKPDTQSD